MVLCPSCDSALDQDFGMVTCGHCQAVLMIDMNGKVQVGIEVSNEDADQESIAEFSNSDIEITDPGTEGSWGVDEDFAEEQEDSFSQTVSHFSDVEKKEDSLEELVEQESVENSDLEVGDELVGAISNHFSSDVTTGDYEEVSSELDDNEQEEILFSENEAAIIDELGNGDIENGSAEGSSVFFAEDEAEELEDFAMPFEPDTTPVDITNFANSESSNLDGGDFLYDVTVGRLDSKSLREEFKYVLMDEKLKLNPGDYLKKIKDGQVVIGNLNPIKAKRVVEQLQYLDISVSWSQKRVVMEEAAAIDEDLEVEEVQDDAIV